MPYTALYCDDAGRLQTGLDAAAIAAHRWAGSGLLWVNFSGVDDADAALLHEVFGFHPLAVEDCRTAGYQRPKIDDYGTHLFLTLHGIDAEATHHTVSTTQLSFFIGPRFLVTAHLGQLPAVDHLLETAAAEPRLMQRGATMLTHAVMDALIDSILPTVDRMDDVVSLLEDDVLAGPRPAHLDQIQLLKRSAQRVHRVVAPGRDVVNRLARGDYPLIAPESAPFFRDIYDHVLRIEDLTLGLRERADNALSTYLSAVSLQQNESTRVLSIVATIFLPLTLIAGIYGMNFENMPEIGWSWGYFAVLGVMGVVIVVVLWVFWLKRWAGPGTRRVAGAALFAVEEAHMRELLTEAHRLRSALVTAEPINLARPVAAQVVARQGGRWARAMDRLLRTRFGV